MSYRMPPQRLVPIAICASSLLLLALRVPIFSAGAERDLSPQSGVRLSTDKHRFRVGEPISVSFAVFNRTDQPLTLHFRNAQRYDFLIENEAGKVLWRWSDGMMFAQALGQVVIGPENPEVRYTETYTGRLVPGRYTVKGKLTDDEGFASASLTVVVKAG